MGNAFLYGNGGGGGSANSFGAGFDVVAYLNDKQKLCGYKIYWDEKLCLQKFKEVLLI